jgi:TonB-linked SusC/RagA family outer membrane protein
MNLCIKSNHDFKPISTVMKLTLFLMLSLILGMPANGYAENTQQEILVSGVITDSSGDELPGVSISIKGTSLGTNSGIDGKYSIAVPNNGAVLVFSYLGFTTQEIPVNGKTTIHVTLSENTTLINEVVVVGYGIQKKVNLTGAVAALEGAAISARQSTDVLTALQGQMAGVTVLRTGGQPGAETGASNIRIRGLSSTNDANALILIDGVEADIRLLNAEDIESVSVLKDAASASIYGARAAAGVILVTTKKGAAAQKAKISYSGSFSVNTPGNMPQRMNPWDEQQIINDSRINAANNPSSYEWNGEKSSWVGNPNYNYRNNATRYEQFYSTNWLDEGTADYTTQQNHSLSVNGGSEKTQYYVSGGFYTKNGLLDKVGEDNYKRLNLRANVKTELNKYADMNLIASYQGGFTTASSAGSEALLYKMYTNRGRQAIYLPEEDSMYATDPYSADLQQNPIDAMKHAGLNKQRSESYTGNLGLHLKNFVKGLTIDLNASRKADYYNRQADYNTLLGLRRNGTIEPQYGYNTKNSVLKQKNYAYQDKLEALVNYDLKIDKHAFHLLGGASYEQYLKDEITGQAYQLTSPELHSFDYFDTSDPTNFNLSDAVQPWKMASLFGRLNYSFADRYLFEATIRHDGSSRLDPSKRWGTFPSFSAGWRVSEEEFFERLKETVSNLKVRGSWGKLGNSTILNSKYYPYIGLIDNNKIMGTPRYFQNEIASKDITWEVITSTDLGIDLAVLKSRLNLTADYYWKTNDNMLAAMQVGHIIGTGVPALNVGKLKTWGWEATANWRDKIGEVSYRIGFNIDDSQNKLVEYEGANVIGQGVNRRIQGYALNTIWGYQTDGYWSSREEYLAYKEAHPGFQTWNDAKISGGDTKFLAQGNPDHTLGVGDGTPENHGDLIYLGDANPRYIYGVNVGVQWRGFDFTMFWQGVGKRKFVIDGTTIAPLGESYQMPWTIHSDYWTPENPNAFFPRPYNVDTFNYRPSDKWVQNGSYIRLKNIQLGYTLPIAKKIIQSARIYVSGADVWEYSDVLKVFDPEVGSLPNSDSARNYSVRSNNYYPFFRTWTAGINVTF